MNVYLKVWLGLLIIFTLTGCFGEEYEFNPPAITLLGETGYESDALTEANLAWRGPGNVPIKEKVLDIEAFGKKQPKLSYAAGETVSMVFDHTDFDEKALQVFLWKNEEQIEVSVTDDDFQLPEEKVEYVLDIMLHTNRGSAQYVGRLSTK